MKKRIISLTLVVVMLLSVTAQAATEALFATPVLQFNGRTATCAVEVSADKLTDKIEVTAALWRGSTCLETWTQTEYGYLYLEETKDVSIRGVTYTLKVDISLNGNALPQIETSEKCPFS